MPDNSIRVLHYGLGPIGLETLKLVAERPGLQQVGAVDVDPAKAGRDAGEVADLGRALGFNVSAYADRALADARPDVVVHCTGSFLTDVMPQLRSIISAGSAVVSTCEELFFPWPRHPQLAQEIDALARERAVAVLGTGVNPGFVMDLLPLVLSAVTAEVRSVRVTRVVDAAHRRGSLQRKIGAGITVEEFDRRAAGGPMGHVGLAESLYMLAAGLGWNLERIDDSLEPAVAATVVETPHTHVEPGQVAGIRQRARGATATGHSIELNLAMFVGAPDPHDEVVIEGNPGARLLIPGGIFGDSATAAIVANAIPAVHAATPGLRTLNELAGIGYREIARLR